MSRLGITLCGLALWLSQSVHAAPGTHEAAVDCGPPNELPTDCDAAPSLVEAGPSPAARGRSEPRRKIDSSIVRAARDAESFIYMLGASPEGKLSKVTWMLWRFEDAIAKAVQANDRALAAALCLRFGIALQHFDIQQAVTAFGRGLRYLNASETVTAIPSQFVTATLARQFPARERSPVHKLYEMWHEDPATRGMVSLPEACDLNGPPALSREWQFESWLEELSQDRALAARLLMCRAGALFAMPQRRAARADYEAALKSSRIREVPRLRAQALIALQQLSQLDGNPCAEVQLGQTLGQLVDDSVDRAGVLMSLGVLREGNGQLSCAVRHYEEALRSYEKFNNESGSLKAQINLGRLKLGLGDVAGADTLLRKSYNALHCASTARDCEQAESSNQTLVMAAAWLSASHLAAGRVREARAALETSLAVINRHLRVLRTDQAQVSYLSQMAVVFEQVASYYARSSATNPDAAQLALRSIEATRSHSLRGLLAGARDPRANETRDPGSTIAAHPLALTIDKVLPTTPMPKIEMGPPRLLFKVLPSETLVFVVTREGDVKLHRVPLTRQELRAKIFDIANKLRSGGGSGESSRKGRHALIGRGGDVGPLLDALSDSLLLPVEKYLPPAGEPLLIEPDDHLWSVPFASLRIGGSLLAERWPLWHGLAPPTPGRAPAAPKKLAQALVLGNPSMPKLPDGTQLSPLAGARGEGKHIAELFARQPGLHFVARERETATWAQLYQNIERDQPDIIHLATHASGGDGDTLPPFLALAPSAVRLKSRNGRISLGPDDGLLTAEKLLKSKPPIQARLVVLSACETGVGQVSSDGVIGLARAFMGVGARSVLVSLWNVSDEATKVLMGHFYEEYFKDSQRNERSALQKAMSAMRAEPRWREATYWAPFLLISAAD